MKLSMPQIVAIGLLSLNVISCASTGGSEESKATAAQAREEKIVQEFEKANGLFDDKLYDEAIRAYDRLLLTYPSSAAENLIIFNAGLSHLFLKDCRRANERFREVIRRTKVKSPSLMVRAQLKLSDTYTCLGDDTKAITNLIEVYGQRARLPVEIGKAEIPAKLAAAYARVGNRRTAEQYFRAAERGIIEIQSSSPNDEKRKTLLAKTLYLMGSMSQVKADAMSPEDYFLTTRALQKYLLKAIEMNVKEWSDEASRDLSSAYEVTWDYIQKAKPSVQEAPQAADDEDASESKTKEKIEVDEARLTSRQIQIERLKIAQLALQNLDELFAERIPGPGEPQALTNVLTKMRQQERKIKNYIATNIVGSTLTAQSLENEAIRISGKVLNPDPLLERQAERKRLK